MGTLRGRGSLMVTYPNFCSPPVWCFRRREGIDDPPLSSPLIFSLFATFTVSFSPLSKRCSVTTLLRFLPLGATTLDVSFFSSSYGSSSSSEVIRTAAYQFFYTSHLIFPIKIRTAAWKLNLIFIPHSSRNRDHNAKLTNNIKTKPNIQIYLFHATLTLTKKT